MEIHRSGEWAPAVSAHPPSVPGRLFHRLLLTLCRSLLTNSRSLLTFSCEAPRSLGSTKWYEELAALKDSERALCFMGCTDQDVEHFCRTCSVDMCSMCGTKHTTDKKTRSHVLISYQEKKVYFLTIGIYVDYEEYAMSKLFQEPYCLHITTLYMEKKHLTFGFGEHISVKVIDCHLNFLEKRNTVLGTGE